MLVCFVWSVDVSLVEILPFNAILILKSIKIMTLWDVKDFS